ncbi:pyridoxal 5'-phosphate synthase [Microbacterium sp. NEAU-LLC]|uniref:Pyridoxal 5'-phosphate synthase n=1 Tax=Microbacterium helvum TaxID=2773713 RepID=A0ABR8NJ79_9MICO|nr:pyridoxal 5'-phosphate synthase [Microbacterium helvum]MBD3940487.1 pyridoxal 5'-phosphate synthase [Microbacterium helvum]
MSTLRERLRVEASIVGEAPPFDPSAAPDDPQTLFRDWLDAALAAGIPEPHAVTLSTVDADGRPDARVLVLKDVTDEGAFEIATGSESAKGAQLHANPNVALTFYWSPLARSVRIRGVAAAASAEESAADFRARNPAAKAIALAGRQSAPLTDLVERDRLIAENLATLEADPGRVSPGWALWRIRPISVEFWQGESTRNHVRLQYIRTDDGWRHGKLWA